MREREGEGGRERGREGPKERTGTLFLVVLDSPDEIDSIDGGRGKSTDYILYFSLEWKNIFKLKDSQASSDRIDHS